MEKIHFWNGNKSAARQAYELSLIESLFSDEYEIYNDTTDYPKAEDEGAIFSAGADVLVTVAGNSKFNGKAFIALQQPLAKQLLGQRIMITRNEMSETFHSIRQLSQLATLRSGIPATWADADLFRANGCQVVEKGDLTTIFQQLANHECDYVALGANEVEAIYQQHAAPLSSLIIEPTLMLHYPLPLVFYVHPARADLAALIQKRCTPAFIEPIFRHHYGDCVARLNLTQRKQIRMNNPFLSH